MLSRRVKKIKPSPTLAIDTRAKQMKAEGIDIVNFGVGEPDFDTPDNIKEAAIKALRGGFTKYTPVGGIDILKDAIIEKFKNDNGLDYTRDEIIVSCGAKHCLYNIAQAILGPGDEVLIPSPYWVSYPEQVILNDAKPVFVETKEEDSFMLKPEILESYITKKTKALILNSPSNPTGIVYNKKELEEIAEIVLKHNFYVISDEIYEKLIYGDKKHISIASLDDRIKQKTIIVNGLSKSYAMTGWRIGYAAGPKDIIKAMTNIQSQSTSNPTSFAQVAAVEALKGPQDIINIMVNEFDKRRKIILKEISNIKGIKCIEPNGAFYAFPNVSYYYGKRYDNTKINSSSDISIYLLEKAKVAVVPGAAFGKDEHIRLSYASSIDEIKKGLNRIKIALSELSL